MKGGVETPSLVKVDAVLFDVVVLWITWWSMRSVCGYVHGDEEAGASLCNNDNGNEPP